MSFCQLQLAFAQVSRRKNLSVKINEISIWIYAQLTRISLSICQHLGVLLVGGNAFYSKKTLSSVPANLKKKTKKKSSSNLALTSFSWKCLPHYFFTSCNESGSDLDKKLHSYIAGEPGTCCKWPASMRNSTVPAPRDPALMQIERSRCLHV